MRRTLLLPLIALVACNPAPSSRADTGLRPSAPSVRPTRLAPARFMALAAEKNGLFLDVRTPSEVARAHLRGSLMLNFEDPRFEERAGDLPSGRPIFVYCASGARSAAAAQILIRKGFTEVFDLSGGIGGWMRAGLPVERPAPGPAPGALVLEPEAFDKLIQENRKVLVDFHTGWCPPCRRMAPVVDAISADWKGRATVLRVDTEASPRVSERERIDGIPSFVLYVDGRERWRRDGELPREVLEAALSAN